MEARARPDHTPFIAAIADDFAWQIIGTAPVSQTADAKPDMLVLVLPELLRLLRCGTW